MLSAVYIVAGYDQEKRIVRVERAYSFGEVAWNVERIMNDDRIVHIEIDQNQDFGRNMVKNETL